MSDWNTQIIEEFRANEGRVGGPFEGAPMILVHHRGRKSGREVVAPLMYLPHETDPAIMYIFASKAGAPDHPQWYHNLRRNPVIDLQDGTEVSRRRARELQGAERDEWWVRCVEAFPNYAEYQRKTDRLIPVFVLEPV